MWNETPIMIEHNNDAFDLYQAKQHIFIKVLSMTGPWTLIDGHDLLFDFVQQRLPLALRLYDSTLGPIDPWLYLIFRNYARRRAFELHSERAQSNQG